MNNQRVGKQKATSSYYIRKEKKCWKCGCPCWRVDVNYCWDCYKHEMFEAK